MRSKLSKQKKKQKRNLNFSYGNNNNKSGKITNFDEELFNSNKENILFKNKEKITKNKNDSLANISQVLLKKSYFIFYFEVHYFMLWNPDFIRTIYPENNLVAFLAINDEREFQEKIFFIKSEEKSKYVPILKKEDFDKVKKIKYLIII